MTEPSENFDRLRNALAASSVVVGSAAVEVGVSRLRLGEGHGGGTLLAANEATGDDNHREMRAACVAFEIRKMT